jgi:hypothetical protein
MKTAFIAVAVSILFAAPVVAADNAPQPKEAKPKFEKHKAEVIKRIDARIKFRQDEKACVQAAKNHEAVQACRDKFKNEIEEHLK